MAARPQLRPASPHRAVTSEARKMRTKYFQDTDTALVDFTDREVAETREISENIYVDLDADGNLVSMTIEHAKENATLSEVAYQEIEAATA